MVDVFLGLEKKIIQLKNINKTFNQLRIMKTPSEVQSSGSWGICSSYKSSITKMKACGYSNEYSRRGPVGSQLVYQK